MDSPPLPALEIVEFTLGSRALGLDARRVREFAKYDPAAVSASASPAFDGTTHFHERAVPFIDLSHRLGGEPSTDSAPSVILFTEFRGETVALRVSSIRRLHRIDPTQEAPAPLIIFHLDAFLAALWPLPVPKSAAAPAPRALPLHAEAEILAADDALIVRRALGRAFEASGVRALHIFPDGHELLAEVRRRAHEGPAQPLLVVTDHEMPGMGGIAVCRGVKLLRPDIAVIVLTAIVTERTESECRAAGADLCLAKSELPRLPELARELLGKAAA
jgi:two-component system chemotaxis response regulator CheV